MSIVVVVATEGDFKVTYCTQYCTNEVNSVRKQHRQRTNVPVKGTCVLNMFSPESVLWIAMIP